MERSLEAFQRAGNVVRQAGVLGNLGVVCQWEGRWDEALSYYERGRHAALEAREHGGRGRCSASISAEILIDRGEWAEADALLLETLPFWKASQYHYHLGILPVAARTRVAASGPP